MVPQDRRLPPRQPQVRGRMAGQAPTARRHPVKRGFVLQLPVPGNAASNLREVRGLLTPVSPLSRWWHGFCKSWCSQAAHWGVQGLTTDQPTFERTT
ncbi:hypothetical protein RA210_U20298 [Rubrivivax sp. A210]|nr:hypothetical protein RA210_U20298 [Rubrivivax sp. A210]